MPPGNRELDMYGLAVHGYLCVQSAKREYSEFFGVWLETVLANEAVGYWTAFEALATDLWVAAVDLRPKTLGVNAMLSCNGENASDDKLRRNPISLDALVEHDFDLRSRLGTFLWRRRQFDFNALNGLRTAYSETFCSRDKNGNKHRSEGTKDSFRGEHFKELQTLEAIRHVFVHRGGRADASFLERMQTLGSDLGKLQLGDVVPLDEQLVDNLSGATSERAKVLIDGVSTWLKSSG